MEIENYELKIEKFKFAIAESQICIFHFVIFNLLLVVQSRATNLRCFTAFRSFERCQRTRVRPLPSKGASVRGGGAVVIEHLNDEGYSNTKAKLRDLPGRLAQIEGRTDLAPEHVASVRRSCKVMMLESLRDIKLDESRHDPSAQPSTNA